MPGGVLPNPLQLPSFRCDACTVGLMKTWSFYVGDVWVATETQHARSGQPLRRTYCPARPGVGGWGSHTPQDVEPPAGSGSEPAGP